MTTQSTERSENMQNIHRNHLPYMNKGLTGLSNLGNTCFINTCLQILSHTYELNDMLNGNAYKKHITNQYDSAFLLEWDGLRKLMWKENCVISPGKFIQTVQKLSKLKKNDQFVGFAQNDLSEFLLFAIDCLHNSLKRSVTMTIVGNEETKTDKLAKECFSMIKQMYANDYSEIWNMFYGVHVSQIMSVGTEECLSRTPEPFFIINLPIPENVKEPTLTQCIDLYVAGEALTGDNAWYNEKRKKKEDVVRYIRFWSFPTILTFDMKRFNNKGTKNQKHVQFPVDHLDLSKYVVGYKKDSYVYELYGIANHTGNTGGGHYFAYIKTANGKWFQFNDTNVTEITNLNTLVSPKAYCLFYRKKA